MYEAKVFRVMMGAPSDIKEEIGVVRKYVNEWNPINSENRGIVIFPINWEMDCHPAAGIAPQDHINKSVTDKSDMMICIFGTRLGTPTKSEKSGTVEELKKHIAANKPAMVYFKTSVRNLNEIQPEQLQKIKDFKEEIRSKTLFREYGSVRDFRNRFKSDFEQAVNEYFVNYVPPKRAISTISGAKPTRGIPSKTQEKRADTKLRVRFSDGTVVQEFYAYQTFVEAIRKIGYRRVMELNIRRCRVALVGNEISDQYSNSQVDIGNGIYVMTHSSTQAKKQDLDRISRKLNLGLEVDII